MEWLNYHHLYYFWVVAREGSITKACQELDLAQPTISAQLQRLEKSFGHKLFQKAGRSLALTETGRVVYGYADEIFTLGRELRNAVQGRPRNRPLRFLVGVADVLPKLIVYRLLRPVFRLPERVQVVCLEGKPEELLARLSVHDLDLVLADAPVPAGVRVRAFSHLLGECGTSFCGTGELVRPRRDGFPRSLDGAPLLLPAEGTTLRHDLERWFDSQNVVPDVRGEFDDSALLKVFGQTGVGLIPVPTAIEGEVVTQYRVEALGRVEAIRMRFYALSVERRLKHPAVVALTAAAREELFT